ncbi:MAG: hypothetical protein Q9195_006842 [Heterodermia aff. obscurata]
MMQERMEREIRENDESQVAIQKRMEREIGENDENQKRMQEKMEREIRENDKSQGAMQEKAAKEIEANDTNQKRTREDAETELEEGEIEEKDSKQQVLWSGRWKRKMGDQVEMLKWRLAWRHPSKNAPHHPLLYEMKELRECIIISWLYMYKDQGLTDAERWEKVTALVNKMRASFKGSLAPWSVEEVKREYGALVKGELRLPHGLHKKWANRPLGADDEEVKAKILGYCELDKEMYADGAV